MATQRLHIGSDWDIEVTVSAALDLTGSAGWTLRFDLRPKDPVSAALTLSKVTGAGVGAIDPATRKVAVTVAAALTLTVAAGNYRVDLWRTDGGSDAPLMTDELVVVGSARYPAAVP